MPWKFVYAHDHAGAGVEGALEDLIHHIEQGCPARYMVDYRPLSPGCFKDAQAMWITAGHVYAQNTVCISAACPGEDLGGTATVSEDYPTAGIKFLDDAYNFYEIVCTTGDVDMTRWSVGAHELRRRNQAKFGIRWFVQP